VEKVMSPPLQVTPIHELVIAFLNTLVPGSGRRKELFESDEDVVLWLERTGFSGIGILGRSKTKGLAMEARVLRELVRQMMNQRKLGGEVEFVGLNRFLSAARYVVELTDAGEGRVELIRRFVCGTTTQMLAPVALAAADLLANGDFRLIKKCDGEHCMAWFYDRTKAHRRRWCNMAICGNRRKAARFRSKIKETEA
jgi:predicted RNA-binding Zn ribbon-like protein